MPKSHRAHAEWSPKRLIKWGESIGVNTGAVVEHLLRSKPHPEQGYRGLPGASGPRPRIRRATSGERQCAGPAPGEPDSQERALHPQKRPRSAAGHNRAAGSGITRARQCAWARLLPLTILPDPSEKMTMLTNPTLEILKSLKLHGMLEALAER